MNISPYTIAMAAPGHWLRGQNPQNTKAARKYGRCEAVGSGAYETVWSPGGNYPWQSSAQELFVASSDNADAGDVLVWGVAADYTSTVARATIAGNTPTSIGTFLNIERARSVGSFNGKIHFGIGAFTLGVPATELLRIDDGLGATKVGVTTVEAGRYAILQKVRFSAEKATDVILRAQIPGYAWWDIVDEHLNDSGTADIDFPIPENGPGNDDNGYPIVYMAGTKFEARAKASVSSGIVTATIWLLLLEA